MTYEPIWGSIIAWYLFLAGLGGGAFVTSVFIRFRHPECKKLIFVGHIIAPVVVIIGLCLLMADAYAGFTHPLRFALLLTNFGSVMTWGVVFLAVFVVVALIVLIMDFMHKESPKWLDIIGMIMGICVAVYTGCLLGVCQGFPLWNNAILPILFLVSAMSTGMAAVLLAGVFVAPAEFNAVVSLKKFHFWLPVVEIVLVMALLFITAANPSQAGWDSVMTLLSGSWAIAFWVLFIAIGLVIPIALECWMLWFAGHEMETSRTGQMISGFSDLGVLIGGFVLRLLIVSAALPITIVQPWIF
ncbi:NrfD/PsrC family molybdoenzyme membrane anchor subunit [Adlercreutzia agrestimuris]|uniref:NrfD/PsrC family molybdoenzyme membrane anchor subunit n=1 Tax=Adlercreutzia agrestimuris TaxID=2941324 RepID=UPI00203BDF23|nr:NrfD/PsrC family molybdoenzyme membrane anchor subunit [Adlercreutzia agrestimuris]